MISNFHHQSVLLSQTIEHLCSDQPGHFLDCTLGAGGHSKAILEQNSQNTVIGIDRDPQAINAATKRLQDFHTRFSIKKGSFADVLPEFEDNVFDGILMDLGVSSPQLDQAERGFSFQKDGPLDMRMNPQEGISAAEWLQSVSETELANVLYRYGEEPRSRRIARAIKGHGLFSSTLELAELIRQASGYRNSKTHPATRSFQAIRIAINDELNQLQKALPLALQKLKPNGILAIISFHSLEDRIVKHFFIDCTGERAEKDQFGNPLCPSLGKRIIRKGIAGKKADPHNPRSRSARLRLLKKLPPPR